MTTIRKLAGAALAAWALVGAAPTGPENDPASYDLRVAVTPAAGGAVQRLPVPAAVLAVARSPELADTRIFDATNRPLPMARIAPARDPAQRHNLPVFPILGGDDALNVTGVLMRLDGSGDTRVARIVGTDPAEGKVRTLGVLLDARAITGTAAGLALAADLPGGQPITFVVEASPDLKTWRPLAEQVVYRATSGVGTDAIIALNDAELAREYLRVTWRAGSRLLSPVMVRSAALSTAAPAAGGPSIAAALPPLANSHTIEFALPFASGVDSVTISPAGDDLVIPVRVLGRNSIEEPWTLLGEGTAARANDGTDTPRGIALEHGGFRVFRIEADRRSSGFTAQPAIRLGFATRNIAFLASGRAPYTLAAGRAGTTPAYLPLESLMTQARGALPVAAAASSDTVIQLRPVEGDGFEPRRLLLWIVLLAATALLAGMAWVLWRRGTGTP